MHVTRSGLNLTNRRDFHAETWETTFSSTLHPWNPVITPTGELAEPYRIALTRFPERHRFVLIALDGVRFPRSRQG